jgi:hypothetical protein
MHILKTIKLCIQLDIKICCNLPCYQDAWLQISSYTCNLIWLHVLLVHIMCDVWTATLPALHPANRHACIMYHVCMYQAIVCMICCTLCNVCSLLTIMPCAPHAVQCCRYMFICSSGYTHTTHNHPTSPHPKPQTAIPSCCAVAYSLAWYDSCLRVHHPSPITHQYIYICMLRAYWKLSSCTYNLILIFTATCHGVKMQVYKYQVTRATWYGYMFYLYISCVTCELQTCPPSILPSGMHASCVMYACSMYHVILCMICYTLSMCVACSP